MEGTGTMLVVAVGPHSQHGIILALLTSGDEDDDGEWNNWHYMYMYIHVNLSFHTHDTDTTCTCTRIQYSGTSI